MKNLLRCTFACFIFTFSFLFTKSQKLALSTFVTGFDQPIDIKNCGDNRIFVAERPGRIRVVNGDGVLLSTPMLNIVSKVSSVSCEEGFLGIAFSPNHKTDRKLYVNYTANISGQLHTVIEEYKVSSTDSNVVDPSSALELLRVSQPFCNHNGGNMMFGKDSMLYIFLGDGGSGGDPNNNGQSKFTHLGKILRVDIRNSSTSQPYVIPPSNPFYNDNTTGIKKEIWAYGLRNPFRGSVDRITGDIWIGDVGQSTREEIDFHAFTAPAGVNYGWRIMEGNLCYNPSTGCTMTGLQLPIYDYPRSSGYSVTGGYVHRSAQSKFLFGMYLFSDYGTKWIDGFRQVNGSISGSVVRLLDGSLAPGGPVGYGEDQYGDLYMCFFNHSTVYKISDTSYLRRPKAYILSTELSGSNYILRGMRGRTVTYQWLKNDNPVPGATGPDFLTTGQGTYKLELTNDLNRKDTSDPFVLSVLSVSLSDFNARRNQQKDVDLSWTTSTENNSAGFVLERRRAAERGFSEIAFIPCHAVNGNSSNPASYSYLDQNNFKSEKLFYRLKILLKDNSFTYSPIRVVYGGNGKGYTIYPNPSKGEFIVDLNGVKLPVNIHVYDINGRLHSTRSVNQPQLRLNMNGLKGVYFVEIFENHISLGTEKVIVE